MEYDEDKRLFEALEATAGLSGMEVVVTTTETKTPRALYVSPGIEELLGRGADEIREKTVWAFMAEEELPRLMEAQRTRLEGDSAPRVQETVVVNSRGERIPVEMFSSIVQLEQGKATVSFIRDISARKRAEEKLRQSEQSFRSLVENAPDAIAILRDMKIVLLNQAGARLAGLPNPEAAAGMPVADLLKPVDRELYAERLDHLRRTGRAPGTPAFYRSTDTEGRDRVVEVLSISVEYRGEPALLVFARDVTERIELQVRLVQSDRLAALGVLAGGIAHEINNPLAYAKLNLTRAVRKLSALSREPNGDRSLAELAETLAIAAEGVERAAAIVRDIQSFARPAPDIESTVDPHAVLEQALGMAAYTVGRKATLTRDYGEDVPAVRGNASRLEQLFLNVLLNAAQSFADEDPENNRVGVSLKRGGDGSVVVEVSDNGRGMSPQQAEHAFDPFFTAEPSGTGTGLGLTICKSIVDEMGGRIELESLPDEGTTLRVSLPADKD